VGRTEGVIGKGHFHEVVPQAADQREREIYFKSHISLWEHSSHFRLTGRGVPSVSVVSQLMYKFLSIRSS